MNLHSTCLPVAHEDEDFYLFTNVLTLCISHGLMNCKNYVISGMMM